MIKMVALDLDGTIVNEDLKISDKTLKVLKHLIQNTDVRVVIATGRMFTSALPFATQIGIVEPLVIYQGAMIKNLDNGHSMRFHKPIPLQVAKEVLELLVDGKYHTNLYINDQLWTTDHPHYSASYAKTSGITPRLAPCLLTALDDHGLDPTKIMAIDDNRVPELLGALKERFGPRLSVCQSRFNFCEIIDPDASKWNALKQLADHWGIQPHQVMAIGDQGNDVSMLTHAGIGVAMGNAPDEVKAIANYVTETVDEDGAANAIEQFVLGHMPLNR